MDKTIENIKQILGIVLVSGFAIFLALIPNTGDCQEYFRSALFIKISVQIIYTIAVYIFLNKISFKVKVGNNEINIEDKD